jgi:hypothetical protein
VELAAALTVAKIAILTTQLTPAQKGVRKPTHRDIAGKANPARIQNEVTKAQCAIPSTTSVAATETRNTKSAAPAAPVGNIENSLCTVEDYSAPGSSSISKGALLDNPSEAASGILLSYV